jgi:hypothetical protein
MKFYLGLALFVLSLATPGVAALAPFVFSAATAVTVATVAVVSGEIAFLISAALLGKPFIEAVKARVKRLFVRAAEAAPARPISRSRHATGLVLLSSSIVTYYMAMAVPFGGLAKATELTAIVVVAIAGEILFLASLFVLGGEFWGRIKALFQWPEHPGVPIAEASGPSAPPGP